MLTPSKGNFKWTKEQQEVIDKRNCNLLVSAAAGSGKTAVLVERIIEMITDGDNPIDIDNLLVVTFTNAAAAEMKERIGEVLEGKLVEEPENVHLQKQVTLIQKAQIKTIHSFCLYIIRNYFHVIDLDPSFQVAREEDLILMQGDVMAQLLEEKYLSEDEAFLQFVNRYAKGKSDHAIETMIDTVYRFSQSHSEPILWLREQMQVFKVDSLEEMEEFLWFQNLLQYIGQVVSEVRYYLGEALFLCSEPDGPLWYTDALEADALILDELGRCQSFAHYHQLIGSMNYKPLSRKKGQQESPEKREQVRKMRDVVKKRIGDLKKDFFYDGSIEQMVQDIKDIQPHMITFLQLVIEYSESLLHAKKEANILDFGDLEHAALEILNHEAIRAELQKEFRYVIVDEYQDSNIVQELILTSISSESQGHPNMFMVGDVKQSIYKFRLARPELFMDKYAAYKDSGLYQKIDLHQNFRSRREVLNSINFIFDQIMQADIGSIQYESNQALYPGAFYPENVSDNRTEVLLLDLDSIAHDGDEADVHLKGLVHDKRELEARLIAKRINELTSGDNEFQVYDKDTKEMRTAQYRDIVILLRGMSGWSDVLVQTLTAEGIPAHSSVSTGYFSALEVQTILSMLQIIDNPHQDLEMAVVLCSPIVGLNPDELAVIYTEAEKLKESDMKNIQPAMIDKIKYYAEYGMNSSIRRKLNSFLELLMNFRSSISYTAIHQILWDIYSRTGYYHYVSAMPAGEKRKANLDVLVDRAIGFERLHYRGLFQFNRYIEKLKSYEVDLPEASLFSEKDNAVRLMTIHKSKGLEFPVVFLAGLGKSFNQMDANTEMVIHADLGISANVIDIQQAVKAATLMKKSIQRQIRIDNLGEELRVLYVACTRAKEKLVMTGAVRGLDKKIEKWTLDKNRPQRQIPYLTRMKAGSMLDFIMPALYRHPSIYARICSDGDVLSYQSPYETDYVYQIISANQFVEAEVKRQVHHVIEKAEFTERLIEQVNLSGVESVDKLLNYQYPYEKDIRMHTKYSVSDVKQASHGDTEAVTLYPWDDMQNEIITPAFIRPQESHTMHLVRGNLYHKFLEHMVFSGKTEISHISEQAHFMTQSGILTSEELKSIYYKDIQKLMNSVLGKRMAVAYENGNLYREQQFVIELEAKEIHVDSDSSSPVIVQGVIDAFFQENGQYILVDYKTDYVPEGEELQAFFRNRYGGQLSLYKKALEKITGKTVSECYIYAFSESKSILCM